MRGEGNGKGELQRDQGRQEGEREVSGGDHSLPQILTFTNECVKVLAYVTRI